MANNYLQFSETLDRLTQEEEAWLRPQLEPIIVVNGSEFPEDEAPDCDEPDYQGFRFLRDYEDLDDDADTRGFCLDFEGTGKDRHAWIYAEESGDPARVAHLVQKFLKQFHPDQCWSLTYATTCSKPRVGEFGGGAVFVTADAIRWQSAYAFVEQQRAAYEAGRKDGTERQGVDLNEASSEADRCAESPTGKHEPDPQSIQPADGAGRNRGTDWLIDTNCLHCGQSGSMRIDPSDFQW